VTTLAKMLKNIEITHNQQDKKRKQRTTASAYWWIKQLATLISA